MISAALVETLGSLGNEEEEEEEEREAVESEPTLLMNCIVVHHNKPSQNVMT